MDRQRFLLPLMPLVPFLPLSHIAEYNTKKIKNVFVCLGRKLFHSFSFRRIIEIYNKINDYNFVGINFSVKDLILVSD